MGGRGKGKEEREGEEERRRETRRAPHKIPDALCQPELIRPPCLLPSKEGQESLSIVP